MDAHVHLLCTIWKQLACFITLPLNTVSFRTFSYINYSAFITSKNFLGISLKPYYIFTFPTISKQISLFLDQWYNQDRWYWDHGIIYCYKPSPRHHGMNLAIVAHYLIMILNYFPGGCKKMYFIILLYLLAWHSIKKAFSLFNVPILFFGILMDSLPSCAGHFPQSSYKYHYLELVFPIVINNQTIILHQS